MNFECFFSHFFAAEVSLFFVSVPLCSSVPHRLLVGTSSSRVSSHSIGWSPSTAFSPLISCFVKVGLGCLSFFLLWHHKVLFELIDQWRLFQLWQRRLRDVRAGAWIRTAWPHRWKCRFVASKLDAYHRSWYEATSWAFVILLAIVFSISILILVPTLILFVMKTSCLIQIMICIYWYKWKFFSIVTAVVVKGLNLIIFNSYNFSFLGFSLFLIIFEII